MNTWVCTECASENVSLQYEDEALGDRGAFTIVCHDCPSESYIPAETTARTRIAALRKIVREHHAARVDGYIVDATTANLLVKVYDALKPANRERFGKPSLTRLVDLAWESTKDASAV